MTTADKHDTDAWLEEYLSGLVERAGFDLWVEEIDIEAETSTYYVRLEGPDKARAIGRDGQVLEAIQHLAVSAGANAGLAKDRIVIDVGDYRRRREDKVREDAVRLAEEAVQTQRPCDFAPMPPRERRLVHMIVSQMGGVRTESVGEGEDRFVRLIPTASQ
ncbi:MAG: KH domain-containing protein [Proteobacteria bacterium]|nr:KH domain-containing protein [Pseudomonadota bacterium]